MSKRARAATPQPSIPVERELVIDLFDDPEHPGQYVRKPITKTVQVRLIGNSVCPKVARALAAANLASILALYRAEDALTA